MARASRRNDPPSNKKSRRPNHSTGHDASVELTVQRKRDLLASVGFLDQDEDLPDVRLAGSFRCCAAGSQNGSNNGRHDGHERIRDDYAVDRGSKSNKIHNGKSHVVMDFDELSSMNDRDPTDEESCDDYSEEERQFIEENHTSTRRSLIHNRLVKLIWVLAIAMAWMYVVFRDSKTTDAVDPDSDSFDRSREQSLAYKGYKDGRMPDEDDDEAAPGWFLDENRVQTDDTAADPTNSYSQSSQNVHYSSGLPGEEAIWNNLSGYAPTSTPYNPSSQSHDIPFFWHIPKCGGTTLQDIMMHCFGMVGANEVGGAYANEGPLQIIPLENGNRYVNVDVTQPRGIEHAKDLGFGEANLADVVLSSRLHEAASLFAPDNLHPNVVKGRCFALLRHPIRRAVSMFFYLRDATWEPTYSEVHKSMTVEEYAVSQYAEDNWMVRFLTNEMSGIVTDRHLDLAKQILQDKCLVGIMEEFPASVKRFDRYFQWSKTAFEGGPVQFTDRGVCEARVIGTPDNAHEHPTYGEGTEVWNKLLEKNRLDLELYEHAVDLFRNVQVDLVED